MGEWYNKNMKNKRKKMRFDILTIFPDIFSSYIKESILRRAQEKGLLEIVAHNIRAFSKDKHRKVDDRPFGGGAGMVMSAEPILRALEQIKKRKSRKTKVVIMSAKGKIFNQKMAFDWAKNYDNIIFISGRYEGIDERVKTATKAEEVSIGSYVLTDGDVAAMVIMSAVARLIPGAIRLKSLEEESHWNLLKKEEVSPKNKGLEYPHYTRPEVLEWKGKKYRVPKVLLSGNHKEIEKWRKLKRN